MRTIFSSFSIAALALSLQTSSAATPAELTPIHMIQGSGPTSPWVGRVVTTSGVVTHRVSNGFFIQDPTGDGDPSTSDGIFVFSSGAPSASVAVGQQVQVTGSVAEFSAGIGTAGTPLTEIRGVSALDVLGRHQPIVPTTVHLPVAVGDSLERFEGMLVRLAGTLTVQQNFFQARFGQLTLGAGGRHETPTNRYPPGSVQAVALADLQARSRLLLDDSSSRQNPDPTPFQHTGGVPRAGDRATDLVGVLDHGPASSMASGPGLYRLQATEAPVFAVANPRPVTPPAIGGNVRIASMNLQNFFTTFTNGGTATGATGSGCTQGGSRARSHCRGAAHLIEFMRQRAKIVETLAGLNADVVGLMELQNDGDVTAQYLVDALNARLGAYTYAIVPQPPEGTGTDAIRVAMIYQPARLSRIGASISDPDPIHNRPPMQQTFAASNGGRFALIVNHLKSRSGCPSNEDPNAAGNTDAGDGQGCWNARRVKQAKQLQTFVARTQASRASGSDVLLLGDFNAYAKEDPIHHLTGSGYVDASGRFDPDGYSYVFDGSAGRIDHALATETLSAKITGAAHWHIDADEGSQHDYRMAHKQPACTSCAPDPFDPALPSRASDHDPLLLGLSL